MSCHLCALLSMFVNTNKFVFIYTSRTQLFILLYKMESKEMHRRKTFLIFKLCHLCSMAVGYITSIIMTEGKTTLCAVTLMLPVKASPLGFTQVIKIHLHQTVLCTDARNEFPQLFTKCFSVTASHTYMRCSSKDEMFCQCLQTSSTFPLLITTERQ